MALLVRETVIAEWMSPMNSALVTTELVKWMVSGKNLMD
jgi:hypothetical protein